MLVTILNALEGLYGVMDPYISKYEKYLGPISEDTAEGDFSTAQDSARNYDSQRILGSAMVLMALKLWEQAACFLHPHARSPAWVGDSR